MSFTLPDLPFTSGALEPVISARTLEFHHGKHHRAYVDALNGLVAGTAYATMMLEDVIKAAAGKGDVKVANNAGQHYAHSLYWQSLSVNEQPVPDRLAQRLDHDFGGVEAATKTLVDTGATHFGSGWVWLSWDGERLIVEATSNAKTPIEEGRRPILVLDVWEHAYYLDWQNRRADHLRELARFLNWLGADGRFGAIVRD